MSDLWYDNSIELVLFRNELIDRNVSEILNLHEYAGEFVQKPISIFDSVEIAQAIKTLDFPPAKIDIGKLTYEYHIEEKQFDECQGLTFKAINIIANSFLMKLSSIYHKRISYPGFEFEEKNENDQDPQ